MEIYVGIDVSKNDLDIYLDGSRKSSKIRYTLPAIHHWLKGIEREKKNIKLIICEATGGYESLIVEELKKANFPVHVVHANKVRYFAKTTGALAKTDKIDSRLLASYGRLFQPQPDEQDIPPETQELQCFVKRCQQLIKQKIEEINRLDKFLPSWMRESVENHIK